MNKIWGTVRRGSIALAGTFLALNFTGSSATAMTARSNSAATPVPGISTSAPGSVKPTLAEPSEAVRTCANGLRHAASRGTCDPVVLVEE